MGVRCTLRQTWRKTVEGERQMMGFDTWNKAVVAVRDRSDQRRLVNGPILLEERERTNDDDVWAYNLTQLFPLTTSLTGHL